MTIPNLDRGKAEGDAWTTDDANGGPRTSEAIEAAGRREHAESGEHLLPAPAAAGYLRFDGGTGGYVLEWGKGIAGVVGGVPGLGQAGRITVTLQHAMADAEGVGLMWYPDDEGLSGHIQRTTTNISVQFECYDELENPVDRSGLVVIYGERLAP